MIRPLSLGLALLLIGGCHRAKTDAIPSDAAAEAQARTSAKAQADIAAAEQAAGSPLPVSARKAKVVEAADKAAPAKADADSADDNGAPDVSLNEASSR
ncbi:hypothetical protein HL653_18210 [Sphingomonas sp. AP4-R1]|uniref:hypothetical protein n=1 Tax=Sphingomonas sp. AP4-R1 TaxID=2735134 RepID=UPI001493D007|nr:hypothetical protein [Sphingomonas sp. AP4-R1]QJU59430.1 hypothetical protein HL653_18210 [Sphingomonas sp. AP4-R1]